MQRSRLASPIWGSNADGIEGIAPALVITAEFDNLHDDGVAYAEALRRAGALVEHLDVAGAAHAYNILTGTREQAQRTYDTIVGHVRRATGMTGAAG
jgi:acetyl esterase/lipase